MNENFTIVKEMELPRYSGKGIYLKHKKTNLKIFYFNCENRDNFFSFNFKTPSEDDSGIAHILEHCVLDGSKKFPVDSLFSVLDGISPASTMNAITHAAHTSFYAKTCIPKDYYNLLEVFGDSVFFPLLSEKTFMEEGWHFEFDENGNPFINGVVYNEMNDLSRVRYTTYREKLKEFRKGSCESFISGGLPDCIPTVTHQKIIDFHKKHYVPANCLLILAGNIPLEPQLDFLQEKLLCNLPEGTEEVISGDDIEPVTEMQRYDLPVMHSGHDLKDVELQFMCVDGDKDYNIERDNFFALLQTVLEEKLIKLDYCSGGDANDAGTRLHRFFTISLYDVQEEAVDSIPQRLLDLLNQIAEDGIPKSDIENFCKIIDYEYATREKRSDYEVINVKASTSWLDGEDPLHYLYDEEEAWERIRGKFLSADKSYFAGFIKNLLIDNPQKAFFVMHPDKNYLNEMEARNQKALNTALEQTTKEKILENFAMLQKFQNHKVSKEELKCLPEIKLSDLPHFSEEEKYTSASLEKVPVADGEVYLFSTEQEVEKKTYVSFYFPVDVLSEEEIIYLNGAISLVNCLGFGNYSSKQTADLINGSTIRSLKRRWIGDRYSKDVKPEHDYEQRSWLCVSFNVLHSRMKEALDLIDGYVFNPNINNTDDNEYFKRVFITNLSSVNYEDSEEWGERHVTSYYSTASQLYEKIHGVNSLNIQKQLMNMEGSELFSRFIEIYRKVISHGALFFVMADKGNLEEARNILKNYITERHIKPLSSPVMSCSFLENKNRAVETLFCPVDVGSLQLCFDGSPYPSKEYAAEQILLAWMESSELFAQIRRKNGAYGIRCGISATTSCVTVSTVRDPNPAKSFELIEESLKKITDYEFQEDTVRNLIIKLYGSAIDVVKPATKGYVAIDYSLSAFSPELREKRIEHLLKVTPRDLHEAAVRLYENSRLVKACIITGDENQITGNIFWDWRLYKDNSGEAL